MKPGHYYVIAAILVAASIPLYRAILHAGMPASAPEAVIRPDIHVSPAFAHTMTQVQGDAAHALALGRARCVGGVVYRTFDHVIEPWPGRVECAGDPGVVVVR